MRKTPSEKSRRGGRARKLGISTEKRVIEYLWPDCPRDEFGSIRDHRELHDKLVFGEKALASLTVNASALLASDLLAVARLVSRSWDAHKGAAGFMYLVEIKSDAWVKGPKAMFSKLRSALNQARRNRDKCGLTEIPVCVVWLPKHTNDVGDAIVLYEAPPQGKTILTKGSEFKELLGR